MRRRRRVAVPAGRETVGISPAPVPMEGVTAPASPAMVAEVRPGAAGALGAAPGRWG